MGTNLFNMKADHTKPMFVKVKIDEYTSCDRTDDHKPHWDPTGKTNEEHAVLINICPGWGNL